VLAEGIPSAMVIEVVTLSPNRLVHNGCQYFFTSFVIGGLYISRSQTRPATATGNQDRPGHEGDE
jgi:hypothetical protein